VSATDPDSLNVWSESRLVGRLWREPTGRMGFRYESSWVDDGFDISRVLPRRLEPFSPEDGAAHIFFANLLPEGGVRERIVRDLKIANSDFELLRAIGGECAGALSLLQDDEVPSGKRSYVPLSPAALSDLAKHRGHIYAAYSPAERPRLSLAGAQDKFALLVRDGTFFLPQAEAPSSHILKFELTGYRHVPAYETFTTMIAREIDLPAVEIDLVEIAGQWCSLTARYDRYTDEAGDIQRMHQEDFCQALGYPADKKYQDSGGPSFADCFSVLKVTSTEPATDSRNLLRWQAFNVLAGNSDGHAKNLSILHLANGETRLAPFYDLVCTRAIERIDHRLAFDVGGERDPGRISVERWDRLASQCDIREQFLRGLVEETANSLLERLDAARESFETRFRPYPALQRVESVIRKQCRRALSS
jgi:serine/threonine-protein kinase HipA